MTKKIKIFLLSLVVLSSVAYIAPLAVQAQTSQPADPACKGAFWNTLVFLDKSGKPSKDALPDGLPQICSAGKAISLVINLMLGFAGGVAVFFIILGGFQYMTSAGNAEQAEKGGKTLRNAIIGLVVIILSSVIVRIVTNALTGGNSTTTTTSTTTSSSSSNTTTSGANFDPMVVFKNNVQIPDSILTTQNLTVSGFFDSSQSSQLRQIAGGSDPSNCKFSVSINGQTTPGDMIPNGNGGYNASVTVNGPFSASGSMPVMVFVCSVQVANAQIKVIQN